MAITYRESMGSFTGLNGCLGNTVFFLCTWSFPGRHFYPFSFWAIVKVDFLTDDMSFQGPKGMVRQHIAPGRMPKDSIPAVRLHAGLAA